MLDVTFDAKKLNKLIEKTIIKMPGNVQKGINITGQFGTKLIKRTWPKRTGNSRRSFIVKKRKFENVISSNNKAVLAENYGSKRHTINARPGKRLTIPINDKVLTSSKAKIKQSSLTKLFKKVGISKSNKAYSKVEGKTLMQVFNEEGIVLAKQANIPKRRGSHKIEKKYMPRINKRFIVEMRKAAKKSLVA